MKHLKMKHLKSAQKLSDKVENFTTRVNAISEMNNANNGRRVGAIAKNRVEETSHFDQKS